MVDITSGYQDCGALGVTKGDNKAFGLLVNLQSDKVAVFCNINKVFEDFNIELAKRKT